MGKTESSFFAANLLLSRFFQIKTFQKVGKEAGIILNESRSRRSYESKSTEAER